MIYKVLNHDGTPCRGGSGKWDLEGGWMPRIDEIEPCQRGYHLCDGEHQLVEWLGPVIWEAEWRGGRIDSGDKIVVSEARLVRKLATWNDRTARLFACDCAERVLGLFESKYPGDMRPRKAIEVARCFAVGKASQAELEAAWSAARSAARNADGGPAENAAWSASYAAWRAIRNAAGEAASAARDAAAWNAVGDATGDVAREAAWDAMDAEQKWQTKRLVRYLSGEEETMEDGGQ